MKIHLVMLGKTRRPEIRALMDDYVERIRRFAEVQLTELREDSPASLRKLSLDSAATVVLLDDAGKASNLGAIRQVAGRNPRSRRARNRFSVRRRGGFSRNSSSPRDAKTIAFAAHVFARTRPRHARRSNSTAPSPSSRATLTQNSRYLEEADLACTKTENAKSGAKFIFRSAPSAAPPSSDENVDAREYRAISVTEHGAPERPTAATRSEDVIFKQQASQAVEQPKTLSF